MAQMRSGGTTVGDALRGILDAVERRDKVGEAFVRRAPEVADVDTRDDDFFPTFCRYVLGLRHEVGDGGVA